MVFITTEVLIDNGIEPRVMSQLQEKRTISIKVDEFIAVRIKAPRIKAADKSPAD